MSVKLCLAVLWAPAHTWMDQTQTRHQVIMNKCEPCYCLQHENKLDHQRRGGTDGGAQRTTAKARAEKGNNECSV